MPVMSYVSSSPYSITPQYTDRMGIFNPPLIVADISDTFLTVLPCYNENPMLLSQDTYGSPTLWWVFSARNIDILRDPIWDLQAGISIAIPSLKYLSSIGISV